MWFKHLSALLFFSIFNIFVVISSLVYDSFTTILAYVELACPAFFIFLSLRGFYDDFCYEVFTTKSSYVELKSASFVIYFTWYLRQFTFRGVYDDSILRGINGFRFLYFFLLSSLFPRKLTSSLRRFCPTWNKRRFRRTFDVKLRGINEQYV